MRLLNAARSLALTWAGRAASVFRRRFGLLNGSDVKSVRDLMVFWARRRAKGLGPSPVSSADGNAALYRTLNLNTKEVFYDLNVENYSANSEILQKNDGIRSLDGLYRRGTAFIVAAGPSLDKNIDQLSRIQGRWPIFACDAALPMLTKHGIEPDYIMIVDSKAWQQRFFEGVKPGTKTKLLAIACVHPEAVKAWPGETMFFNSWGDEKDEAFQLKVGKDFGSIGVGGNVSTGLLWLVTAFCEASRVILVGHDFSYPPGRYYAKGGIDELASGKGGKYWWDANGNTVLTNVSLWAYRIYTEKYIEDLGLLDAKLILDGREPFGWKVINATEGGILGTTETFGVNSEVIESAALSEVLDQLDSESVGSGACTPAALSATEDRESFRALAGV